MFSLRANYLDLNRKISGRNRCESLGTDRESQEALLEG